MSDRRQGDFPPSINAGRLYERTAASGRTYLTGYFGSFKITAFKTDETSDKGDPIWRLTFGEAPARDPAKATKAEAARPRDRDAGTGSMTPMQSGLRTPVDDEIPF